MFITAFKILIFCHFTDDGSCKGAETFELKKLLTSVRDKIIKMLPSHTGLFNNLLSSMSGITTEYVIIHIAFNSKIAYTATLRASAEQYQRAGWLQH